MAELVVQGLLWMYLYFIKKPKKKSTYDFTFYYLHNCINKNLDVLVINTVTIQIQ